MKLKFLLCAAALLVSPACATLERPQDGLTVLRSIGPSAQRYPVGAVLLKGSPLQLRPGDAIYLVQGDFLRIFRGPGTFEARMAGEPALPMVGSVRRTTGAVRGSVDGDGAGGTAPPDPALSRFFVCPTDPRCPR